MGAHSVPAQKRPARVRALLAGGLVLGIGGTVTLAAWTDAENASGTFAASRFSIEANVSNPYSVTAPWTVNETAPGATLAFDAAGMYPEKITYAPIALRTRPGSVSGSATLLGAQVTDTPGTEPRLGAALVYRVVLSQACNAEAFRPGAAFVVGSDTTFAPLTTGQRPDALAVLAPAGASTPGASTHFCFQVTLPKDADQRLQGTSATAVWRFSAESTQ